LGQGRREEEISFSGGKRVGIFFREKLCFKALVGSSSSSFSCRPNFECSYFEIKPGCDRYVTMNVYPVPSGGGIPVGVHFTPTVNERRGKQMIIGPGACIAFDREGYKMSDISFSDLW
jgi:L-2-hydroxyglutarate oxidase LhgO